MAVHASHRTANVHSVPSIFEIIAQDSLNNAIYPALKRVTQALAIADPKHFQCVADWYEEIHLGFNSLLQLYYLRYEGASFSEAFYGLERVSSKSTELTSQQRIFSLICLVLVPYLKNKLTTAAVQYKFEDVDGLLSHTSAKDNLKRTVYQLEPVASFAWQCLKLTQYLRYLTGKSVYSSPEFTLLCITLRHCPNQRYVIPWSELWQNIGSRKFWNSETPLKTMGHLIFRTVEVGAFFLQFLQWWYSETALTNLTALPVPKAPIRDPRAQQYKGVCPICMQKWKIPTVVPVSGFVFCYRCIMRSLKDTAKCPVTNFPTSVDELIRIYDD